MKHSQNRQSSRREWCPTALTTAVLMALSMTSVSVNSATNGKPIGDLEIYEPAAGGKVTITMMLDTSGSMTSAQSNVGISACDLPAGSSASNTSITTETSSTSPTYTRRYCATGGTKTYFYKKVTGILSGAKWYRCGSSGQGSTSTSSCGGSTINAPSVNGFLEDNGGGIILTSTKYYYKNIGGDRYYDRLTRLKDAIFTLMGSTQLDSNKVAIGIGQFSSQSNANNAVSPNEDGVVA